jgi:pimeloyl-ACP methyl ester carboxylesterase
VLPDGRHLGYAEYGSPDGKPLFVFQGTPTSRLPHNPLATECHARLIVPERPGFGLSDFQPGRTLLDWPADVLALARHLGVDRFSVVGISGGAPHALVCGARIPERIHRLGIASGFGPIDAPGSRTGMATQRRVGAFAARHLRFLVRPLMWAFRNPARNPERFVERFTSGFPGSDAGLLQNPELRSMRARSYAEATRRGVRGFAWEVVLVAQPWRFSLADVPCQVHLWHGEADASTPVSMARHVADSLPQCTATYFPGEGHFVAARHWDEIVATLIA